MSQSATLASVLRGVFRHGVIAATAKAAGLESVAKAVVRQRQATPSQQRTAVR
jgi:hypothetical protein